MKESLRETLQEQLVGWGIDEDSATALAERLIQPPANTIEPDELAGAGDAQRLLLAAIIAASEHQRFDGAFASLVGHLDQCSHELNDHDLGRLWHMRGFFAWRSRNAAAAATRALNRAIERLEQVGDERSRAYLPRVFDTFGQFLRAQGLLVEARFELERALELRDSAADEDGVALTLGNLGRLCLDLGDFAAAEQHLRRDLEIVEERTPDATGLIALLSSQLGVALLELGRLDDADVRVARSLELAQHDDNFTGVAFAELSLGRVALARGDREQAESRAAACHQTLERESIPPAFREWVLALVAELEGETALARDEAAAAVSAFQRSWEHAKDHDGMSPVAKARIFHGYARAHRRNGDDREAGVFLRQALLQLDATTAEDLRSEVDADLREVDHGLWLLHSAGRFVGHQQLEPLLEEAGHEGFRGDRRDVVILFSDIRGFTPISETLPPEQLIETLNTYLGDMTRCIEVCGGMVDKFIGDAVMAIFTLPEPLPDDADRAAEAALFMQAELERFNRKLPAGTPRLSVGMGLHKGSVVAGLIGSPQKRSYTVIGDAVNTASRLEGMTKQVGATILISREVQESLPSPERFLLRPLGRYRPKGRKGAVEVFDLMGEADDSLLSRRAQQEIEEITAALVRFRERDFTGARGRFTELARSHRETPRGCGYDLLARTAESYEENPPDDDWGGEVILQEK